MWASCCNWMCMDTDTVEDSGGGGPRHNNSYTNSGYSSHPSPPPLEHNCKACGGRFDTPARKHVCVDCRKNFCGRCSAQLELRPRLCHTCQRFYGNLLERAELMKLKVKELRDYLHLHEVSTHLCREKEELVELILGHQSSPSSSSAPETPTPEPSSVTLDPLDLTPPAATQTVDAVPPSPEPRAPSRDSPTPASTQPEPQAPPTPPEPEDDAQSRDGDEILISGRRASLSDLNSLDDIEALSVRQLKEILARNFVDYKGCCEKWELMERVNRLYMDQQNLAAQAVSNCETAGGGVAGEDNLCKICMDSPIDCVLLECGHMITCTKCGKRMSECPICRQYVIRAVHVFRS